MNILEVKSSVKVVGNNGQISLGKEFAGGRCLWKSGSREFG